MEVEVMDVEVMEFCKVLEKNTDDMEFCKALVKEIKNTKKKYQRRLVTFILDSTRRTKSGEFEGLTPKEVVQKYIDIGFFADL
ncbi:MAG: hypothetical protein Q8873_01790 [Bacillota bacterium]|nr:hypothetical protein [Bacillota bacterium]